MASQKNRNVRRSKYKKKGNPIKTIIFYVGFVIALIIVVGIVAGIVKGVSTGVQVIHEYQEEKEEQEALEAAMIAEGIISSVSNENDENVAKALESLRNGPSFESHYVESTNPSNLIESTDIEVNGTVLNDISLYSSQSVIEFGQGNDYTDVEGIISFRGNNFRDSASYGYAEMNQYSLTKKWSQNTDGLTYGSATWTGSGWTGQPLITKWPKETRALMNMYDWAKEKEELIEVIYACMDGYIYFMELESGQATRDKLYLGYTFKGSGALDPRGYPIMYVGAGYDSSRGTARSFIINLLDCSVMYEFGNNDPFSTRGSLSYFDASAVVDAETDTLIYPGENGILYLVKLNTNYNAESGTLSINPDYVVKWRYNGTRTNYSSYWVGMETSPAIYKGYLFTADNGGNLMCINLNTLELVWVQDILDDSNSTPVLSVENGKLYLYVSTSFHLGWRSSYTANVPIWKIDAETGEIIWQVDYECYSQEGVSGGVQSTIAMGKHTLSDYIYVTVSKTGGSQSGVLVCINKYTGEKIWEHESAYAWSSPVCVYNSDGSGKVIYCDSAGNMYLLNAETGEVHSTCSLSEGVIEASPAVYENYAVVGTRDCKIWGIELL